VLAVFTLLNYTLPGPRVYPFTTLRAFPGWQHLLELATQFPGITTRRLSTWSPGKYYPTELRQKRATLSLSRRTMDPKHLLHDRLLFTPTHNSENSNRGTLLYRLRWNYWKTYKSNTTAVIWADHKLNTEWQKNTSRLRIFIPSPGPSLLGMTLPRLSWVRPNGLRTCVGLFRSTMHKWTWCPRRTTDAEQRSKRSIAY